MITAMQAARLKAAKVLLEARQELHEIRYLICWPSAESDLAAWTANKKNFETALNAMDALFDEVQREPAKGALREKLTTFLALLNEAIPNESGGSHHLELRPDPDGQPKLAVRIDGTQLVFFIEGAELEDPAQLVSDIAALL